MSKTTFTGKGRLGLLLCLTGLLSITSLTTATAVRAQDDGRPAQDATVGPDGTTPQNPSDDPRYNNPNGDPRYNNNSNGNNAGRGDDPRYANSQANEDGGSPDAQDPPSRVARLSYLDGSVSFQAGGSGDWGNAAKNRPVTIGDKIWVDKDSRAELQAGQASIHLGMMTALSFLNLDQNITQMRLAEGSINFRVRVLRDGDTYEVDTPNVAFTVREAGVFRIDVNENGDGTLVTVIRGEGEVTAGGKSHVVRSGELAEFNGTDSDIDYHSDRAPQPDDFDRWASDRDRKEENSVSARYVSRDTVGYSDLDDNGTWSQEPNYGPVWYPNSVAAGWAPYSNGYWGYVGPWGWTWIGYEPWGFAPYHYGRWNYFGGRWGWCPGPIGYYPVYGPAFVGFLGSGFGFGFGVGIGVGWFPLGFGEIYHPWYGYRAGGAYIRNINIHNTYIRNANNVNFNSANRNYAYAHNASAVTATTRAGFVNGQAVNRGATPVSAASLRNAQVTNRVNMTPTRASYTGAANARGGRVATPPASVQNRAVIARTAPAAAASHQAVRTVGNSGYSGGRSTAYAGTRSTGNSTAYGGRGSANSGGRSPNRPSYAGSGSVNSQGAARYNPNRPPSANSGTYNSRGGSRSYSAPSRGYSAPSRTYSAPSHSSAPSRGSSGGGRPSGGGGGSRGGSGSHGR
jgi:FecR protein